MNPKDYNGSEWTKLLEKLSPRQIKNSIKSASRRVSEKARAIAAQEVAASGLDIRPSNAKKQIQKKVFRYGNGFSVGVGMRGVKTQYHRNRRYGRVITRGPRKGTVCTDEVPVLLFAEQGTKERNWGWLKTAKRGGGFTWKISRFGRKNRDYERTGRSTGRMPAYRFLEESESKITRMAEKELLPEIEKAVMKAAKKAGFT